MQQAPKTGQPGPEAVFRPPLDQKPIGFIKGQVIGLDQFQHQVFCLTEFEVVVQSAAFMPCPLILKSGDPAPPDSNRQNGAFACSQPPSCPKMDI